MFVFYGPARALSVKLYGADKAAVAIISDFDYD